MCWAARSSPRWCSTTPGLGKFTLNAIQTRDYSFIQAQLVLLTASVLIANLASDVLNLILDPRLRSQRSVAMTDILPAYHHPSPRPRAELDRAPSQRELMAELGGPPAVALARHGCRAGAQLFVTNKKGMFGPTILLIFVLLAALAPLITPYDPYRRAGKPHVEPGIEHFLGTTRQGKDNFSQLLEGGRASLTVGFVAGFSATLIGLAVGISAGYFGGRTDEVLTFFVNVSLVLPALPLIIVLASFIEEASPTVIGLVLALTGWGWSARTIRTQTLALKNREFVLAAELMGESKWRIIAMRAPAQHELASWSAGSCSRRSTASSPRRRSSSSGWAVPTR